MDGEMGNLGPMLRVNRQNHAGRPAAKTLGVFLLSMLVAMSGRTAEPAARATLPYGAIAALLDGFVAITNRDKLRMVVRIEPAGTVPPTAPVKLEIRSISGPIPVRLSPDGVVTEFPLTLELHTENPPIVSNQPKGTLRLRADMAVKYPGRLTEAATYYRDALVELNAAVKSQAAHLSFAVSNVDTLVFNFNPDSHATVTLKSPTGEVVTAAEKGAVRLKLPPDAQVPTTTIILSEEPKLIGADR
jgi:hypothetical protein